MYAMNVESSFTANAKGVNRTVTKNVCMCFKDYKYCLFNNI